jgi:molybdopterin molybdotransferase
MVAMSKKSLTSVEDALKKVLDGVKPLPSETVQLNAAIGRVLAADLKALRSQPPFDVSAMDGYAARAADLASGKPLKVVGTSSAGHPFEKEVRTGEATRIFTGAVMPKGADTVVEQELAQRDADIVVLVAHPSRKNVRPGGRDFREGDVLLQKGIRLSPRTIGLAAAMDHAKLECAKRPRVAILGTGDELVAPGEGGAPDRIVASNPYSLAGLCAQEGAEVVDVRTLKDRVELIADAIAGASADVVVTLGGASVGDHDLIRPALEKIGANIDFHRIALRPGRPTLFGSKGATRILGLPGNPVSAFVCGVIFLVPLLRKLQGHAEPVRKLMPAVLGVDLWANDERADYLRATSTWNDKGQRVVTPFLKNDQDSSFTATLAKADCLLVRPANATAAKTGDVCQIIPLSS